MRLESSTSRLGEAGGGSFVRQVVSPPPSLASRVLHWSVFGLALLVVVYVALVRFGPTLALWWRRTDVVETLERPRVVTRLTSNACVLDDGTEWNVPGAPLSNAGRSALWEVTRRGLDVDSTGRVFGLLPVHHWCGNDPVRRHIARIDIAQFLECVETSGVFLYGPHGWDVSQYRRCFPWVVRNLSSRSE